MRDRSHDDAMMQIYKMDHSYAIESLNYILDNGEDDELIISLRQMLKAFGKPKVDDIFIPEGDLTVSCFLGILKSIDMKLTILPR